jgi:hypothetical protein
MCDGTTSFLPRKAPKIVREMTRMCHYRYIMDGESEMKVAVANGKFFGLWF